MNGMWKVATGIVDMAQQAAYAVAGKAYDNGKKYCKKLAKKSRKAQKKIVKRGDEQRNNLFTDGCVHAIK